MIHLKRLLVATDFSSCSKKALHYAEAFSERFGSEIHLLHVVEDLSPLLPAAGPGVPVLGAAMAEIQTKADQALQAIPVAEAAAKNGVVKVIRNGSPHGEVVKYAKEAEIDMIILGTHGRTGLTHILLGSVAEKILRHAPCPVLTVRPQEHEFVTP